MREVEALSEGRAPLSTGTLYGALKRMPENSWIERVPDPQPDDYDRDRKAYGLRKLGHTILKAETARLRRLAKLVELHVLEDTVGSATP